MNIRRPARFPRLILYKALALSSLALAATLFCALPARAGHWLFSAAGSTCQTTITNDSVSQSILPWSPPPDADTKMTLNLSGETLRDSNPNPALTSSCECKIEASVQIKATWTHENTNTQNDTNDPPPTSVWVVETSSASWAGLITGYSGVGNNVVRKQGSGLRPADAPPPPNYIYSGSASDGLGDLEIKSPMDGPPYISGSSVTSNPQNLAPPPTGWHKYPVQGDQIMFTGMPRSLLADGTATGTKPGQVGVECGLGPYTITIHAQPYGWHDEGHFDANGNQFPGPLIDNTAGTMTFLYTFRSTSGNIADLKAVKVYEYVDYSGNDGSFGTDSTGPYYRPPSPPIGKTANGGIFELDQPHRGYLDPTVAYPRDSTGHTMSYAGDMHSPFPTMKDYSALTITAPQKYEFDDPATNDIGTVLYDPGNIVDAVKLNPNVFYISKSGYSVTSALPQ